MDVTVRNLDEAVVKRLEERSRSHGRPLEDELKFLL